MAAQAIERSRPQLLAPRDDDGDDDQQQRCRRRCQRGADAVHGASPERKASTWAFGRAQHLRGGSDLDERAVDDLTTMPGQALELIEIVGDPDHRDAVVLEGPAPAPRCGGRWSESSELVGSSNSTTSGSVVSDRARHMRWASPPERSRTVGRPASGSRPTRASGRRRRPGSGRRPPRAGSGARSLRRPRAAGTPWRPGGAAHRVDVGHRRPPGSSIVPVEGVEPVEEPQQRRLPRTRRAGDDDGALGGRRRSSGPSTRRPLRSTSTPWSRKSGLGGRSTDTADHGGADPQRRRQPAGTLGPGTYVPCCIRSDLRATVIPSRTTVDRTHPRRFRFPCGSLAIRIWSRCRGGPGAIPREFADGGLPRPVPEAVDRPHPRGLSAGCREPPARSGGRRRQSQVQVIEATAHMPDPRDEVSEASNALATPVHAMDPRDRADRGGGSGRIPGRSPRGPCRATTPRTWPMPATGPSIPWPGVGPSRSAPRPAG